MTNPQGPPTPAGWFRDPAGSDQLRWWDGNAWTAHLAPVPQPAPMPQPTPTVLQAPALASADPTARPYVLFQNSWSNAASSRHAPSGAEFARPAQWNTAGVWFVATSLLWAGIVGFVVGFGIGFVAGLTHTYQPGTSLNLALYTAAGTVWLVLLLVAAGRDRARLLRMGYLKPPSVWWIVVLPLTPLAYLIVRTVRVRAESGHGAAPLVFLIVNYVLVIIGLAVTIVVLGVSLAAHGGIGSTASETANATSLATGITTGMEKNGGSYSVTCTPFTEPTTSPIDVTCIAVDLGSQESHTLQIEVDPGVDGGQPTEKLLSVSPPISQ